MFFYILECCILNSYVLDSHVRELAHKKKGRSKLDILKFHLELGQQLIGCYSCRSLPGRPRSDIHTTSQHLQINHKHWPILTNKKNNCVVCAGKKIRKKLPARGNHHETRIKCKFCNTYLCVATDRNCFEDNHTKVNYCM